MLSRTETCECDRSPYVRPDTRATQRNPFATHAFHNAENVQWLPQSTEAGGSRSVRTSER